MEALPNDVRQKLLAWSTAQKRANGDIDIKRLRTLCMEVVNHVSETLKRSADAEDGAQTSSQSDGNHGGMEELKRCITHVLYLISINTNAYVGSVNKVHNIMAALVSVLFDIIFVRCRRSSVNEKEYENAVWSCFHFLHGSTVHAMDAFLQAEYLEEPSGSDLIKTFVVKLRDKLKEEKSDPLNTDGFLKGILVYHAAGRVIGCGRKLEKSLKKVLLKRHVDHNETFKWICDNCPVLAEALKLAQVDQQSVASLFDATIMTKEICEELLNAVNNVSTSPKPATEVHLDTEGTAAMETDEREDPDIVPLPMDGESGERKKGAKKDSSSNSKSKKRTSAHKDDSDTESGGHDETGYIPLATAQGREIDSRSKRIDDVANDIVKNITGLEEPDRPDDTADAPAAAAAIQISSPTSFRKSPTPGSYKSPMKVQWFSPRTPSRTKSISCGQASQYQTPASHMGESPIGTSPQMASPAKSSEAVSGEECSNDCSTTAMVMPECVVVIEDIKEALQRYGYGTDSGDSSDDEEPRRLRSGRRRLEPPPNLRTSARNRQSSKQQAPMVNSRAASEDERTPKKKLTTPAKRKIQLATGRPRGRPRRYPVLKSQEETPKAIISVDEQETPRYGLRKRGKSLTETEAA